MEQRKMLELNKHDIYLLSDNNIAFYISIPKVMEFNSVNISIDLKDNFDKININKNDIVYVKDELANIYQDIDSENITLITPIFYNDILERIKTEPKEGLFSYLDKCLSYIINNAHKVLVEKNIQVNSKIVIVKNDKFANFINWFSARYSSRVDTKQYSELLGDFTSIIPVVNTDNIISVPTEKVNADNNLASEVQTNLKESHSTGFISYVLLGVIGIVITLVILYMLL